MGNFYKQKPVLKVKHGKRAIGKPIICDAKDCGKKIIYLPTRAGNWMPTDFESIPPSDLHEINLGGVVFYNKENHMTHFATCSDPDRFRKK